MILIISEMVFHEHKRIVDIPESPKTALNEEFANYYKKIQH